MTGPGTVELEQALNPGRDNTGSDWVGAMISR